MVKGTARFNALALGEGNFNFLSPTVQLKTKSAFIDPGTGKTHGWTETMAGWSPETIQKLGELRASIERDLAAVHFSSFDDSGLSPSNSSANAPLGLGEHLQDREAPQI